MGVISNADVYWQILQDLIPLAFVGGTVSVVLNLAKILHEKTWVRRIISTICVVAVGFISAGVAALGLSLFIHSATPEIQIVSAAISGSAGQRIFDVYGRRIFGKHFIATTDLHEEHTEDKENSTNHPTSVS